MKADNVLIALIAHNNNESNLRYAGENTWRNEKTEYAELTGKLSECVKNENIRGTLLVATDHDIAVMMRPMRYSIGSLTCVQHICDDRTI